MKRAWFPRLKSVAGMRAIVLMLCVCFALAGCSSASKNSMSSEASSSSPSAMRKDMAGTASSAAADSLAAPQVRDQAGAPAAKTAANAAAGESKADGNTNGSEAAAVSADQTAASGFTGTGPADGAEGFSRKLIYKANLTMQVADYGQAQSQIRDLVQLSGGYILQFSENQSDYEEGGNYTIKVPSGGFTSFLDGLEKMKPLKLQRSIQGQDVSEEYVDLNSSLKAKQAVEARLLDFMNKATGTDDLLAYSRELSQVQEEIEKIKGRMRYIDQNVAFSTVELRVYQGKEKTLAAQEGGKPLLDRLEEAMAGSLKAIGIFFQGILIVLAAVLPVLVIVAVIAVPTVYYARRRRQRLKELARSKRLEHNRLVDNESRENGDDASTASGPAQGKAGDKPETADPEPEEANKAPGEPNEADQ